MRIQRLSPYYVVLVALASGCGQHPVAGDASVSVSSLATERVALEQEWRDAFVVPPGEVSIDLGEAPRHCELRLGVLPMPNDVAEVEVRVGNSVLATIAHSDGASWKDTRLDLSAWLRLGSPHGTLVCRSTSGFRIGPCELVLDAAEKPNVLILLIDTLRHDHLGCYHYPLDTSPNIDRLAEDGVRFWRLMPQSSWTKPSIASLFTSTYPAVHGAEDKMDVVRPGLPDIAGALKRAGYETIGFMTNPHGLPPWGFGNNFSRYVDVDATRKTTIPARDAKAADLVIEALRFAAQRPWFMYVHFTGPHRPYESQGYSDRFMPEKFVGTRAQVRVQKDLAQYDGEIARTDELVGRIIQTLKELGEYDDTLVIVLSDHGEQFMEHGENGHGLSLFEEELRIPLILKLPGNAFAGGERKAIVEMVDVSPTILDIVGLPVEAAFQGKSFRDIIEHDRWEPRAGFASLDLDGRTLRSAKNRYAKYIFDENARGTYWYNLEKDPGERTPRFTPPEDAAMLEPVAARRDLEGAPGLHLLITCGDAEAGTVRATLTGSFTDAWALDCAPGAANVRHEAGSLVLEARLAILSADSPELNGANGRPWTRSAHLVLKPAADEPISVRIERDGTPVDSEHVFFAGNPRPDASMVTLRPPELLMQQPQYLIGPAGGFSVHLWTIGDAPSQSKESLGREAAEALEALGYLH